MKIEKLKIYMETYGRGRAWSWVVREVWAFGPILFVFYPFFFHSQVGLSPEKPSVISFRPKTQKPRSGKTFSMEKFAINTLEVT